MFGEDISPDVTVLGGDADDADIAIVGGIHGDEPSGVRAVRRVIESDTELQRPVKLVVANTPAVASHRRYLDVDMNRVFPGDPDAEERERRLAAQLQEICEGCLTISIHSTHSHDEPIAIVDRERPQAQEVAARLPVPHVVEPSRAVEGGFPTCQRVVSIEAGYQGTEDATENARDIVEAFLQLTDAVPGEPPAADPTFYTMLEAVPKDPDVEYTLEVENFSQVPAGATVARTATEEFVADEPFVPILMSETGYDDILGYRGETAGDTLAEARETWLPEESVADAN